MKRRSNTIISSFCLCFLRRAHYWAQNDNFDFVVIFSPHFLPIESNFSRNLLSILMRTMTKWCTQLSAFHDHDTKSHSVLHQELCI